MKLKLKKNNNNVCVGGEGSFLVWGNYYKIDVADWSL